MAIARAYMREAQVLILDEPTAALDARAEFEVFKRFKELSAGENCGPDLAPLFQRPHGATAFWCLPRGGWRPPAPMKNSSRSPGRYSELFELQAAGYR